MCIPPRDEEPSLHFALLGKIARRSALMDLSMGMSGDFEKAIAFGATHVRIGTAIFGARANAERITTIVDPRRTLRAAQRDRRGRARCSPRSA